MTAQRVFFTSDTHFGHGNIIKYCHRPFLSELDKQELSKTGMWHDGNWKGEGSSHWRITNEGIAKMDEELLKQINDTVGENDLLYHLGDFAMPGKSVYYSKCRQYRDRIKCRNIVLIWGNHDERSIRDLFTATYDLKMESIQGLSNRIVLCHYAMAVWDGSHRGNWQLYGHSHSEAEPWMDRTMIGRRSLDVGVDNAAKILGAYRPFSLDDLKAKFANCTGFAFDHHVGKMANTPTEESLQ
jgi:calcineurin-like phosphoesterase family protein